MLAVLVTYSLDADVYSYSVLLTGLRDYDLPALRPLIPGALVMLDAPDFHQSTVTLVTDLASVHALRAQNYASTVAHVLDRAQVTVHLDQATVTRDPEYSVVPVDDYSTAVTHNPAFILDHRDLHLQSVALEPLELLRWFWSRFFCKSKSAFFYSKKLEILEVSPEQLPTPRMMSIVRVRTREESIAARVGWLYELGYLTRSRRYFPGYIRFSLSRVSRWEAVIRTSSSMDFVSRGCILPINVDLQVHFFEKKKL